jgi:hypothetical protein
MAIRTRLGHVALVVALSGPAPLANAWAQAPPAPPSAGQLGPSKAAVQQSATAELAPHRAIYEIKLDQTRSAATVTEMTGRMVYELTGSACDGYSQSMRFVSRMTAQDGSTGISDMRSSSSEDGPFRSFRFSSSQYRDSKLTESTNGEATRADTGAETKVELTRPRKKDMRLKGDVFFPIQHSVALLAAAKRGETIFQADLYDGSEKGEKVYSTTTYIGQMRPAGYNKSLPGAAGAERLDTLKSWPVSISYFEAGSEKKDVAPNYELAFVYFENGISRRLFIDYGDFSIRGTLTELTLLEPAKCDVKR